MTNLTPGRLLWANEVTQGNVVRLIEWSLSDRPWFRVVTVKHQGDISIFLGRKADGTPVQKSYNNIYGFEVRDDFPNEEV